MFFKESPLKNTFVPEIITKDWLNDLLIEQKTLISGELTSVVLKRRFVHHHSDILFLQVHYSVDAQPNLPSQWVLKVRTHFEGVPEIRFYQQAAASKRIDCIPRAGVIKSWKSGESVLLLENLQESYKLAVTDDQVFKQLSWRPTAGILRQQINALARFHACWWESPELLSLKAEPFDYDNILSQQVLPFKNKVQPGEAVMALLEQAVTGIPRFIKRADESHTTLVHGDCYPWHFFIERTGQDIRLFDFEFSMVQSPAYDLISLLSYWQGDYLKGFRQYHDALVAQRVTDYDFETLLADIRLALAAHTLRTVGDWHRGCSAALWETKLTALTIMSEVVRRV